MTDTNSSIGRLVWYDLLTTDPKAAVAFYTHVIGWTEKAWTNGYTMFLSSQGPLAGAETLPEKVAEKGAPPQWKSNVYVGDVDAAVAQTRKLGGAVYVEAKDYQVGRLAVIADPQGASLNLFKPNEPIPLHELDHQSSHPGEFVWSELLTTDRRSRLHFYSTIFGWEKLSDFDMGPMGKYLIYGCGGKTLGGMFTKPKDMPTRPSWMYYIDVADLDAAIGRATDKGARVINGPMEVPGGARIVQLTDPQGAMFSMHQAAKK